MTAVHTKRCIPRLRQEMTSKLRASARSEPQHGGALTTDEALKLYQDYDICGSRLPYREAKLASNVAGAELFELWVDDRAVADHGIPAENTDQVRLGEILRLKKL